MTQLCGTRESGQALIFLAIVVPTLALFMGLAVEGGRVIVTYRQMQAAADMAALVGAQKLPNAPTTARTDACTYAQNNGYDGCTSGGTQSANGTSKTVVCVPPETKSPYSFINYGSGNLDCSSASTSTYIEVQISNDLGSIPIFNIPVSVSVTAVARNGIPGVFDYAIVALDSTTSNNQGLFFNPNNGVMSNGSMISNNNTTSSINQNGSGNIVVCNGRFYATGNETTTPNNIYTYNPSSGAAVGLAPPSCNSATTAGPFGSADSPVQFFPNAPPIADSYASTQVPTTGATGNMYAGCQLCANDASHTYYLDRSANQWLQASATPPKLSGNNSFLELWPGTYPSLTMTTGTLVLNPGVYTFTGGTGSDNGVSITGGVICIYGSPACDEALSRAGTNVTSLEPSFTTSAGSGNIPGYSSDCGNSTFGSGAGQVPAATWYYWCSPWGTWDSSPHSTATGSHTGWSNATPPQFIDPTTGTTSDSHGNAEPYLNGVTFYMQGSATGATSKNQFKIAGSVNAGFLAMPNPCIGSGSSSTQSVSFPAGGPVSAARSTYLTIADSNSASGFNMYPNGDLTAAGDAACTNPGLVWAGEFGAPNGVSTAPYSASQHLHFLVFAQNGSSGNNDGTTITLTGSSVEQWWGILHTFPPACYYTGQSSGNSHCSNGSSTSMSDPPTSSFSCPSCSITIGGGNGGSGGPPMLFGQIVGDNDSVGGSSVVDVFNRPGGKDFRRGSSLIQ